MPEFRYANQTAKARAALTCDYPAMGFNRRKMDAEWKAKADAEAPARRATDAQVLEQKLVR
jgi:hypothetical protein